MTESLQFYTVAQLRALSLRELHALWELVPTERQRAYKTAYEREVRTAGALGSDALEQQVAAELVKRYDEAALVPIGARWARTPTRVQEAAKQSVVLDVPENEVRAASRKPSPKVAVAVGLVGVVFLGLMISRLLSNSSTQDRDVTPTITLSSTPDVSPTPTPLALEAQDDVIQGGDSGREVAYPVNLQIATGRSDPRVWVVQRRRVQASEWRFDPNPDTASFVNGMSVRPVIGIPWSEENKTFFDTIRDGTEFLLTMNTGAVLRFTFVDKRDVRRSETNIFRQVSPGLVLLLMGETDEEGLPTATRTLITATYPPEQELSRDGQSLGLSITLEEGSLGDTLVMGDVEIALQNIQTVADTPDLPPDMQYLLMDMTISAGMDDVDTSMLRIEFIDVGGQVYPLNSTALNAANYDGLPLLIPALSSLTASIGYIVPRTLSSGRWMVTDLEGKSVSFTVTLAPSALDVRYEGVDVRLVSVTTTEGQITTKLRIYNGRTDSLHFTQDDIWLALGYAPEPPGPRNPAEGLTPFELLPEQAVDLTLVWYWNGESYASMGVGEYQFAVQFAEPN